MCCSCFSFLLVHLFHLVGLLISSVSSVTAGSLSSSCCDGATAAAAGAAESAAPALSEPRFFQKRRFLRSIPKRFRRFCFGAPRIAKRPTKKLGEVPKGSTWRLFIRLTKQVRPQSQRTTGQKPFASLCFALLRFVAFHSSLIFAGSLGTHPFEFSLRLLLMLCQISLLASLLESS